MSAEAEFKNESNASDSWLHPTDRSRTSYSTDISVFRIFKTQQSESFTETEFTKTKSDWKPNTWSEMKHGRRIPLIRKSHLRLRAGGAGTGRDLFMRPTLFQRGVVKRKPHNFDKEDLPTNWGLYKRKQEMWQSDGEFTAHPTTTYSRQFKWWGKEREPATPTTISQYTGSPKPSVLPVKELTNKDWNKRGHRASLLPIPWQPPEPRSPSDLARSAHCKPDDLRLKEINARLARTSYEVQHPTEKWASNLYLN